MRAIAQNGQRDISERHPPLLFNTDGGSPVLLICEHASRTIPDALEKLGLGAAARTGHIAWDPGALEVARTMASRLDAVLVAGSVSRLVYDCNRPPEAEDSVPARSEVYDVPGNTGLSAADRRRRADLVYTPFHDAVAAALASPEAKSVLVTVHSFELVFMGVERTVELGVLHDGDRRLADAILAAAPTHTDLIVRRNEPYDASDGVTHTLKKHGVDNDLLNMMIEIRNNLISTAADQTAMATMLAGLLGDALAGADPTTPRRETR